MAFERPNFEQTPQANNHYKILSIFTKSALATAVLAGLIAAGALYTSGTHLFASPSGDDVSDADQRARIEAFNSLKFLLVSRVVAKDIPGAINTMHLASADEAKIRIEIGQVPSASSPAGSDISSSHPPEEQGKSDTGAAPAPADHSPAVASDALPSRSTSLASNGSQMTLAWVRLWDTDVEDGDVVRIDSAGYSRTVTLTSGGVTFAIPVPANGQVRITGVRDGDGGGITVGLASGSAQAILPIMSVGQVLTLNVRTN
ncbi:hypothetical protein [Burkholderia sp. L27(2015)]|uniref:hypothetical protein n=1 Tax=Burkholderia sp. L27(2015) TaxID=1641858 RepID=UPI00131CE39D|nr:hypothetical protein [Burkholderia sp. L27(2015)]